MGTYVGIKIKNFDFILSKNSFGDLLFPFSPYDLNIVSALDNEGEQYTKRFFKTSVGNLIKILDTTGFSIQSARTEFEKLKIEKLEYIQYCIDEGDNALEFSYDVVNQNFTFENWRAAALKYASIIASDLYDDNEHCYPNLKKEKLKSLSISERIILDSLPFGEGFWGFMDIEFNIWSIFRVLLDAFSPEEDVILDYTELYESGWCDEVPSEQDYSVPKTIILTEGSYDAKVIATSINLLYPFMSKFFSFINFSEYKVQGSTNFLSHYVKAFIAAGIQNRVIALYDNDSAGLAELQILKSISPPPNFRILHLPNLELAENYPTLGSSGKEIMNVNGKACSIEMFLGKDVLSIDGELTPIQWKGFIEKTQTYQGEIMNKTLIQKRFDAKCCSFTKIDNQDPWKDIQTLLDYLFNAFN